MARILVFGQAKFGAEVFTALGGRGHEVIAVSTPPARGTERKDPLEVAASDAGVRVIQRKSYRGAEAAAEVGAQHAELCVLAYVTQIIPRPILDAPKHGSICFHPSLLPAYRGGSAIPWQLINGETTGGVTVFRPDDGIDTGPVYVTKPLVIGADDSAASYYYNTVFEAGVNATIAAAEAALAGERPSPQDEREAGYQPLLTDALARIQWGAGAGPVHNLVRGCDPAPGAWTKFGEVVLRCYGSSMVAGGDGPEPGVVVSVDERGLSVGAATGLVRFAKLADAQGKAAAAEVAARLGLKPGGRLR